MNRTVLYYIAAILWGTPGVIIAIKGLKAYMTMHPEDRWWLMLITAFVLVGFFFMFRKAVDKYSAHIASQPEKTGVWATFPLGGWILLMFMSCLGVAIKHVPCIPAEFTAAFYSGLGPMLIYAAYRFISNQKRTDY